MAIIFVPEIHSGLIISPHYPPVNAKIRSSNINPNKFQGILAQDACNLVFG